MSKRTVYKLTNQNLQTYRGFQWALNETKRTSGKGELCSTGWLHAYEHPLLAVIHNHIHADFTNPRLFKARIGKVQKFDGGMKLGAAEMTLVEEVELPTVPTIAAVRYAIANALMVYKETDFVIWATGWLNGEDRSEGAAESAERAAWAAMVARYYAKAASAAAKAAWTAAKAAARAERAAWTAARAAESAERVARYDASATSIDNTKIIKWAMTSKPLPNDFKTKWTRKV